MRAASIAVATSLLALANAQSSIPGLPECAGSCISGSFGSCGGFDANCICNDEQLIANLACCVSVSCSTDDQDLTLTFAQGICASYDANLPETATCAPGAQSTPVGSSTGTAGSSSTATAGGSNTATTTAGDSSSSTASAADQESSASASASSTPNLGARNDKVESGLGLGLAVAGLIAAI